MFFTFQGKNRLLFYIYIYIYLFIYLFWKKIQLVWSTQRKLSFGPVDYCHVGAVRGVLTQVVVAEEWGPRSNVNHIVNLFNYNYYYYYYLKKEKKENRPCFLLFSWKLFTYQVGHGGSHLHRRWQLDIVSYKWL